MVDCAWDDVIPCTDFCSFLLDDLTTLTLSFQRPPLGFETLAGTEPPVGAITFKTSPPVSMVLEQT